MKLIKDKSSMDPIWNEIHRGAWGKYPSESLVRFLCRYKKAESDFINKNKILDLGCGGGANTKMMLAEGFDVCAVDGAKEAVNHAKVFVGSKKVKYYSADFLGIEPIFAKNYFDIVCDNVSIYANTLANIENILGIISKIIKKNGLFYSSCFSTKNSGFGLGKKLETGTYADVSEGNFKGRGLVHFYTEKELRRIYGKFFEIKSFDTEYYTEFNGQNRVYKYVLICRKK